MNYNLVANFQQTHVMLGRIGRNAAAQMGACHNFTIEWISLMFQDGGTVTDVKAKERMSQMTKRGGAGNPVLQKVFNQCWSEGGAAYKRADSLMLALRGLKEVSLALDYKVFKQTELINVVKNPPAAGLIYSFWFPGGAVGAPQGAHTIGFYRPLVGKNGQLMPATEFISAFDPNFGEFYISDVEFNYWMNKFKAAYGGTINYQMLKTVTRS